MDIQEAILKAFEETGAPMRPGEVAEKTGMDKKLIDKEIKKMKDSGALISPKRCFYDIKR